MSLPYIAECPGLSPNDALIVLTTIQRDLNDQNQSSYSSAEQAPQQDLDTSTSFVTRDNNIFATGRSALDRLQEAALLPPIVTFCSSLDAILGGGVPIGKVTEFCGLPGVGKTQIGMQLAINTFIPAEFGGCAGKAIFIDTEGSFVPTRALELVQGLVTHMDSLSEGEASGNSEKVTEDLISANLHYYRVHNYIEQLSIIGQLKDIVTKLNEASERKVRCVIVDSITFHFRAADQFSDGAGRNRLLSKMASELSELATSCQLAVIVTNQMTTKQGLGFVPALGDVWGHHPSTRLVLEVNRFENKRKAVLVKSSSMPHASASYRLAPEGVRGDD